MMLRTKPNLWINPAQVTQLEVQVSESAEQTWQIVATLACGSQVTIVTGVGLDSSFTATAKVLDWLSGL